MYGFGIPLRKECMDLENEFYGMITLTTIEDVVEPIMQIQIGCRPHFDLLALITTTIMEKLLGSLIPDNRKICEYEKQYMLMYVKQQNFARSRQTLGIVARKMALFMDNFLRSCRCMRKFLWMK